MAGDTPNRRPAPRRSLKRTPRGTRDPAKIWSLNYRLLMSVLASASPAIGELGLETKELFVLAEVDAHPHPAEVASALCMPKPTVTVYLKRLQAAGFVRREIGGPPPPSPHPHAFRAQGDEAGAGAPTRCIP